MAFSIEPQLEDELELELWEAELELESSPAPQWPPGRVFFPPATTIPIPPGRYPRGPLPCETLNLDAAALREDLSALNRRIVLLDQIKGARPRDQRLWDETVLEGQKFRASAEAGMRRLIDRLRRGVYQAGGCTKGPRGHFAQVRAKVGSLQLQGGWRRHPALGPLRRTLFDLLDSART